MLNFGKYLKDVEYNGVTYEMYEDVDCPSAVCDICDFRELCAKELHTEKKPHLDYCEKESEGNGHTFFYRKR